MVNSLTICPNHKRILDFYNDLFDYRLLHRRIGRLATVDGAGLVAVEEAMELATAGPDAKGKIMKKKIRKLHNLPGRVTSTAKTVVLEIDTGNATLELHFGDPVQLMNLFLLAIEEMAKVFPDFEASKLWVDDTFS